MTNKQIFIFSVKFYLCLYVNHILKKRHTNIKLKLSDFISLYNIKSFVRYIIFTNPYHKIRNY